MARCVDRKKLSRRKQPLKRKISKSDKADDEYVFCLVDQLRAYDIFVFHYFVQRVKMQPNNYVLDVT